MNSNQNQNLAPLPPDKESARPHESPPVSTTAPANMGRKLGIFGGIVVIGLAIGFFIVHAHRAHAEEALDAQTQTSADTAPAVDVVRVIASPASEPLNLPGETRAWYQTTLYARVNGYVGEWFVDIGDHVKKGQVLATIETPETDQQLAAAKAKLKVSQAQVTVAQSNTEFAKSTYDRWWQSPAGVVSDQERQEKKEEYDSSVARVLAAQAQVSLDQADVDRLSALIEFKQVTAPFDGIVTARRIDIGDLVTAGSTQNTTSLYSIAQSDRIRVFVEVPQNASLGLREGMNTQVTSADRPGQVFTGCISRTAGAIDPVSRTLRVEVDIPNPQMVLLPGMYVEVNFSILQGKRLQIPASALLFRTAGPQVAVVDKQGKVNFRKITIARDEGDTVEVVSGVSADDRVALNISNQVIDGDTVTINDVNPEHAVAPNTAPPTAAAQASVSPDEGPSAPTTGPALAQRP